MNLFYGQKNWYSQNIFFQSDVKVLVYACKGDRGISYFRSLFLDRNELFKHYDDV